MKYKLLLTDGTEVGPFTRQQILTLIRGEKLQPEDRQRVNDEEPWTRLDESPEFKGALSVLSRSLSEVFSLGATSVSELISSIEEAEKAAAERPETATERITSPNQRAFERAPVPLPSQTVAMQLLVLCVLSVLIPVMLIIRTQIDGVSLSQLLFVDPFASSGARLFSVDLMLTALSATFFVLQTGLSKGRKLIFLLLTFGIGLCAGLPFALYAMIRGEEN